MTLSDFLLEMIADAVFRNAMSMFWPRPDKPLVPDA
jgi:hypothetical protein